VPGSPGRWRRCPTLRPRGWWPSSERPPRSGSLGRASLPLSPTTRTTPCSYEALNLADGKRTVAEIRDVLAGRYQPVPVAEVAEYLELLVKARVVNWK